MIILLYILFCIYPFVFGIINAFIYGRKGADSLKIDEHWFILLEISCVYIQVEIVSEFRELFTKEDVRMVVLATLLSHPFLKQAGYFETRDLIDGSYPKGWMDDSTTSTAIINFKFPVRVGFFLIAIALIVFYECYY